MFSAKCSNVGKRILFSLIEQKPKFAKYFGINSESITAKELEESHELHLQAERIQNFLSIVVNSLGKCPIASIYNMANQVGHIHYHRGVNFGADTWLVFKRVTIDHVIESITSVKKTSSDDDPRCSNVGSSRSTIPTLDLQKESLAKVGWHRLMTVIIREMKRGFLEEAISSCQKIEEDTS